MLKTREPDHELSIGETLTLTFDLYLGNFIIFFIPILIWSLISGYLSTTVANYIYAIPEIDVTLPFDVILGRLLPYLTDLLIITLISLPVLWILNAITHGICVTYASHLIANGRTSLQQVFDSTTHNLLPILASTLIVGVLTGLGLIALIVPGIVLAIMFVLVVPVILNENVGLLSSLSRSKRLVSGRWLKTFGLFLIVVLIFLFISFIGSLLSSPFGDSAWLVSSIISAIAGPIIPVSIAAHYYSLIAREERQKASTQSLQS